MAKGARASTVKRNNANLRAKIFGPAVDERTARLSAKLQDLISKPRPNEEKAMDVDTSIAADEGQDSASAQLANDMEIDTKSSTATKHKSFSRRKSSRIEKKMSKKKPKHRVVFPTSAGKQKRISQSKKKSV